MDRDSLTAEYLEHADRLGLGPDYVADAGRDSFDLAATTYVGRCLSRPAFLDGPMRVQLESDLTTVQAALADLPARLFGGDVGAFARAAGMNEAQVTAIERGAGQAPSRMARADLYCEGRDFRLMEINMGSAIGGLDNALLNRALMQRPEFTAFARDHQLRFIDTMAELARTVLAESNVPDGQRPLMAAADWPASFPSLEARLRYTAIELDKHGIEAVACHVGQLRVADGRVWLGKRPVDVIYRLFMVEDLLDPSGPELVDPVLRAAERGEVAIFAPMHAELFGSKSALAMLSDEDNRHVFSAAELAGFERVLPWTRMVRRGPVTVDNETVDLLEYAVASQQDLILKPTMSHGGSGVVPGWEVGPDEWLERLVAAADETFVVQRRIRPQAELFLTEDGLRPWTLTWGAFMAHAGYAGMFLRGNPIGGGDVVNMSTGATGTCCFHTD